MLTIIHKLRDGDNRDFIDVQNEYFEWFTDYLISPAKAKYIAAAELIDCTNEYLNILRFKSGYYHSTYSLFFNLIAFYFRSKYPEYQDNLFTSESDYNANRVDLWRAELKEICNSLLESNKFVKQLIISYCYEQDRNSLYDNYAQISKEAIEKLILIFQSKYKLPEHHLYSGYIKELAVKHNQENWNYYD